MKFRRFTAGILAGIMVMGLAACGKEEKSDNNTTEAVATGEATEETVEEQADLPTESSLKGTGPASPGDASEEGTSDNSAQLKDGDVLVDINFDDNDVDGFMKYTNGGSFEMSAVDGELVVDITNCGGLDYANQIFWDGFALSKNCVYTYSFDVHSDIERKFEYRLQINGGDYHAYQGEKIDIGPDVTNFSVDFEMTEESDPAPRIVFNMGKMEDMTADPGEHNIYIDNIKLEVKDASNAIEVAALPSYVNVAVNQMGYKPGDEKIAVVKSDRTDEEEFIVCDASTNETVYAGKLGDVIHDYGADLDVRQADFSALKTAGEYYVFTEEGASYKFKIEDNPYADIYKDSVLMLTRQRCGEKLDASLAGDFAHDACHTGEAVVYDDQSKSKDVSGGWHDAGDYGKYVVAGAVTIADLMLAYEDFGVEADDMGIPESGNGVPDILDEARYELDWMLKMQDEETGGVYHKVSTLVFPETIMPQDDTEQLYLAPISATATGDFAAIMAKASVVYKDIDPDFSAKALDAAKKAWDYLDSLDAYKSYRNPKEITTGEYPDDKITDERYWAAAELYLAGETDRAADAKTLGADDTLMEGLGWADIAYYADYDLAKCDDKDLSELGKKHILDSVNEKVEQSKKTGYNLCFGSNFYWGSNMGVGNDGELLYMAYKITGDEQYKTLAKHQLDYLLGTNALGYCFVSGYGTLYPENPHHRPSQSVGKAMIGMLAGGPDKNMEDPYAIAVLGEESPAMSYVDNAQSYSTNEVTIYWNSPLIYLLAAEQ